MIPSSGAQNVYPRERPPVASTRVPPAAPVWRWLRLLGLALGACAIVGAGAAMALARFGGAYAAGEFATEAVRSGIEEPSADPVVRAERLEQRLAAAVAAHEVYITVDSYRNRLRVWKGKDLLREAVCSTGSGVKLKDPRNGNEWIFDTPQDEMKILRKVRNPVWVKPDWAFCEEGFLPPNGMRDRVDDFSLGDYGLYMRDGYIIHGTIFKTLLGKRVTHGCIRLGDEDLKFAYDTVPAGARVFLY